MKKLLAFLLVTLLTTLATAPAMSAQGASGDDLCLAALNGVAPAGYTIVSGRGGSGSQVVLGTEGNDILSGGSGNDIVCGFAGNDVLSGGSGDDILVGGPGADQLYGGGEADTLFGDTEDTALDGGSGRNQIIVAEPPAPPALTFVATLGSPGADNTCAVSFTLTNGPANANILVDVIRDDGSGVGIVVPSDASGFAEGTVGGFTLGTTIAEARARNDDISVNIAEVSIGQTCGA